MRRSISAVLGSLFVLSLMTVLVPSADAAPLQCGSAVTRSRVLTSNLNCTGDALIIRASDITLNLGGYTITGDSGSGDFGVDNTRAKDNVVIKNGTLQFFDDGVRIGQDSTAGTPTGNVVRSVVASNNTDNGIDLDEGGGHRVIGSRTENNAGVGIDVDANRTLVQGSTSSGNSDSGIELQGNRNVIAGSTAEDNGDEGFLLNGNRNKVKGSRADDNAEDGVDIEGNLNVVTGSSGTLNASNGVDIEGDDNKIVGSNFSTNDSNGVFVTSGDGTRVKESTLSDNGLPNPGDDVGLGYDGQAGSNSTGIDVTCTNNDNPLESIPDICLP